MNNKITKTVIVSLILLFISLVAVNALTIGGRGSYYNGSIDELRIWNSVLSLTEALQHYYSNLYKYDIDKWIFYTNQSNLSLGTYTYQGCAADIAGNENCTEVRYLTITNTPPTQPQIIYPVNSRNYSDIPYINYSSSDIDNDIITYDIYINGTLNITTTTNITDWNASDGYYSLSVTASDGINSSPNSTITYFRLDTIAPSFSNEQTNASLMRINGIAEFNITISDYGSGLSYYIFSWNGTGEWDNNTNGIISGNSINLVISKSTTLIQGNTIGYRWYANDSLNQWNQSLLRTFTVANTAPATPILISPPDLSSTTDNYTLLRYNSTDADNDTITFYIYNSTDNIQFNLLFNGTGFGNSSYNWTNLADGDYYWKVKAGDSFDNSSNSSDYRFTVSTTYPSINLIHPPNNVWLRNNIVEFDFTATDANGISQCRLWGNFTGIWHNNQTLNSIISGVETNFSKLSLNEGNYIWNVWCNDTLNYGQPYSSNFTFYVDTIEPSFSNEETNASLMKINGNAQFNITVTDNGAGLNYYIFSWNGTGAWDNNTQGAISGNSIKLTIDRYTSLSYGNVISYIWYVNDSAGNQNQSLLRTFTVANTDITLYNAINGSPNFRRYENFSANITITDMDNDLIYYIFSTNNSGFWQNDSLVTISGTTYYANETKNISLPQGNYICWKYYANDIANSIQSSSEYCFTVQNTGPTTPIIIYPQDGMIYRDVPYINFYSTDADNDILTYDIYINGILNITTNVNITDWNASDGLYDLAITARDSLDSSPSSPITQFRLDSTPPSFYNQERNETPNLNENVRMNITIIDPNCHYYMFFWNYSGTLQNDSAIACTNRTVSTTKTVSINRQRVCWGYWANDTAGNTNSSSLDCFTVGNTPPIFTGAIADQTWSESNNLTNIFTLNNYFSDPDNDPLTYNVTGNLSIKVIIDPTTSNVTLTSPPNWHGTETIYFTATDGVDSTNSNYIFLTVINIPDCGDNIKEVGEECDGTDLAGQSCISKNYHGGSLSCTSSCTFDTSNCYYERLTPPPSRLPTGPPAITGTRGTLPCARINYTETNATVSLEKSVLSNETIEEGYEVILEPFSLKCNGETIDLTVSLPENYEDATLLKCKAGVCSPSTITTTTKLQCLDLISRELARETDFLTPELMELDIKSKKLDISEVKKVIQSGNNSIRFYGAAFKNLTAEIKKSEKPIEEAKNQYLKIIGTPLVVKLNKKEALGSEIKLPYIEKENIEMESLGIYAKTKEGWDYIGGNIDKEKKLVSIHIDNIAPYLDENNTAVFAIMGIICEYCYDSFLKKVYNGTSRDAIILVHGLASSPETFNEIIADIKFTEQSFQTWTFAYSSQRKIDEITKDFMDLVEAHSDEFDRIYIVAHSLGALIVQKALYESHNFNYKYVSKVRKAILVGAPNEGSVFVGVYEKLYKSLINKAAKYKNIFNINSELVDNLKDGFITPKVPGIGYYVIAGTNPYELGKISELKFINETHDGIVTVKSAQHIGDDYINQRCLDYWDTYVTHTRLIDDDSSRKLIEKIIAEETLNETGFENIIGNTKYFELKIVDCSSEDKYVVTGKRIPRENIFEDYLCGCGNGICEKGEDEFNCLIDCAEYFVKKERNWLWLIIIAIVISFITSYYVYTEYKILPIKKKIASFEELYREDDRFIRENRIIEAILDYRELKNRYNELLNLPIDIKEKYKLYFETRHEFEGIIWKLRIPEIRFYILINKIEEKIWQGRIKEAMWGYIKLKRLYPTLMRRSNFRQRWIFYNRTLQMYKKLVKLKKSRLFPVRGQARLGG